VFESVLIANRGEIAVRIARTLRTMGIRSVVAASIPDRRSLAVRVTDDRVLLEGYSAAETYLDIDAVIAAAKEKGCQAIHPGYGFLSERADFAERCAAEGIVFVGPPPEVLRGLGDKAAARRLAVEHGVPVVPGWEGEDDDATLIREAGRIGYPVMLKARGGGGGRGMREVFAPDELPEAIESARREAAAAFGDGGLLLEKLLTNAHHVEVQVLADTHGNLLHLGERDCSVQRRHQKLIEETPSPVVDDALRERLTAYALTLARAISYVNAGTFEFLVVPAPGAGDEPAVYFLEVNPRLQVEHPVTEMVTGLDLVQLQLRIAAGEPLPLKQEDVKFSGHAIEFRINAEDPWDAFKPSSGRVTNVWERPGRRHDLGVTAGDVLTTAYDSLIGKEILQGPTRDSILSEVEEGGLCEVRLEAGRTNRELLMAVAGHDTFRSGRADTHWLEVHLEGLLSGRRAADEQFVAAAVVGLVPQAESAGSPRLHGRRTPFTVGMWLGAGATAVSLDDGTRTATVAITLASANHGSATVDGRPIPFRVSGGIAQVGPLHTPYAVRLMASGISVTRADQVPGGSSAWFTLVPPPPLPRRAHTAAEGATAITAPLAGTIAAVRVAEGDAVEGGQLLVVLEAMKMEHRITAPTAGTVKSLPVRERDVVREGDLLAELA